MNWKTIFDQKFVPLLLVLALMLPVLAACSDDDDNDKTTASGVATTQPTATTSQPTATNSQPPTVSEEPNPFTIVVLPDTQRYSFKYPEIFIAQTEWIIAQKGSLSIAFVIHEGDLVDTYNSREQYEVADEAMSLLDGEVPYSIAIGNHDYTSCPNLEFQADKPNYGRDAALFNEYFGPQRFAEYPWYGGHFQEGNENAYYLLDAGGTEFLMICLEFSPRDETLQWANEIVSQYKDRKVIVVTHAYLNYDNTRIADDDPIGMIGYGCSDDGNGAEDIWQKFISKHENIFLVLSGHVLNDGVGRLDSIGNNGNTVHQIVANYQIYENGGNGWLRIMKFIPAEDKIVVTTFSPTLNDHLSDPDNEFEIKRSH